MRTTKSILITGTILLMSIGLKSQKAIGIKGGVTLSSADVVNFIPGMTPEPSVFTGAYSGIMAEVPLEGNFIFRPEINFAQKGFVISENITDNLFGLPLPVGGRAETRLNYLEVPLLMQYRFGNEKAGFYVNGGPGISYLTSGRIQPFARVIVDVRLPSVNLDLNSDTYNRFEFSGIAGVGGDVSLGQGKVFADIRYSYGFTNTLNDPIIDTSIRNMGWSMAIGYKISI